MWEHKECPEGCNCPSCWAEYAFDCSMCAHVIRFKPFLGDVDSCHYRKEHKGHNVGTCKNYTPR